MAKFHFDVNKIHSKINFINEYNYYVPKRETLEEADDDENADEDQSNEQPEDADLDQQDNQESGEDVSADDLGLGDLESAEGEAPDMNMGGEDMGGGLDDELGGDMDMPQGGDEVELDITDLVDKIENNNQEVSNIGQRVDSIENKLDAKFSEFANKVVQISTQMTQNLNDLQKNIGNELKKRNPTPNEQLQMQSLNSFPYNQKLTDFWKPVDNISAQTEINNAYGNQTTFDVKSKDSDKDEPEYTITQADIDQSLSDLFIKDSF